MSYRRSEPSRRDRWKTRVLKTTSLTHGTKLFLVHVLAKHMKADGFVSQPRKRLAHESGLSERQVARYISNAVTNGWLVLVAGGYKTMTAEYQATFPDAQRVTHHVTQSKPVKGDMNGHPKGVTNTSPFTPPKGDVMRHPTSSSTTRALEIAFGTNCKRSANAAHLHPSSPLLGFGMTNRKPTARTVCRTQPRTVERHRPHVLVAAQVETPASGTDPATRFVFCPTRPRRKAQR